MITVKDIINSPEFIDAVVEASAFTSQTDQESGFAIYSNEGPEISLSRILKGRNDSGDEWDDELRESLASESDDIFNSGIYTTINMTPVTSERNKYDEFVPRKDILLNAHTHPLIRSTRNSILTPSITDLELFENIEMNNPGVVSVIIVPEHKLCISSLLILKRNPSKQFIPGYHGMDYIPGFPANIRTLEDFGFTAGTVELDTKSKKYKDSSNLAKFDLD